MSGSAQSIWGTFGQTITTHFGSLFMTSIIQIFFLQATLLIRPNLNTCIPNMILAVKNLGNHTSVVGVLEHPVAGWPTIRFYHGIQEITGDQLLKNSLNTKGLGLLSNSVLSFVICTGHSNMPLQYNRHLAISLRTSRYYKYLSIY